MEFDYKRALYRRNNFGQPCVWFCKPRNDYSVEVYHGIIGKNISCSIFHTKRNVNDECKSRFLAKRKVGYKYLNELKDNVTLPVKDSLPSFLNSYLPEYRTNANGNLLPMLAKVYDNNNNKLFKKVDTYIGQYKINGLRCFITAQYNSGDLFKPISLVFQSREGTIWKSLTNLEEYLLGVLDNNFVLRMIEEHIALDGEVYLPGHTVNEIDHFVKDANCAENKLLQYWCYDLAVDDYSQDCRTDMLIDVFSNDVYVFHDKNEHLNNKYRFVVLPPYYIDNDYRAIETRDSFISYGFEGLILRNPNAEYQYGKRNNNMIKFKKSTDGKFTIIDIYPEGIKRKNIPLFLLKNDINDETFEVHVGGSQEYQSHFLNEDVKQKTIGRQMFVEYGERSGVNQVPFHVKSTYII